METFMVCIEFNEGKDRRDIRLLEKDIYVKEGPFIETDFDYIEKVKYFGIRPIEWCERTGIYDGFGGHKMLLQFKIASKDYILNLINKFKDAKIISDYYFVEESE